MRRRILFILPKSTTVLDKGYQVRAGALTRHLAESNDVRVIALDDIRRTRGLRTLFDTFLAFGEAIRRGWPLQVALFDDRGAAAGALAQAAEFAPDACIVVTERLPLTTSILATRYAIVVDAVDALALNFSQRAESAAGIAAVALRHEAQGFLRLAADIERWANRVIVSADRERQTYPHALTVYNAAEPSVEPRPVPLFDIAFTGNLNYWANIVAVVELCVEIMPRLRTAQPSVRVVVAGRQPTRVVRELCAQAQVTLLADVKSISSILRQSRVAVAPLRYATGLQLKVVEALAVGTPIFVYEAAAAGLPRGSIAGLTICRDADAVVAAMLYALGSVNGPRAVLPSRLTWAHQARRMATVVQCAIQDRRSSRSNSDAERSRAQATRLADT